MLKYILKQSIIFRSFLNLLILATNYNLNIQIQIMDTPFVEQAIPMVSVDEKTGSNHLYIQNTYSHHRLSSF